MNTVIQIYSHTKDQELQLIDLAGAWSKAQEFWSAESIIHSLKHPDTMLWYAHDENANEWLGMTLIRIAGDDAELLYIYTAARCRGRGLGKQMLSHVLRNLTKKQGKLFLEVRPSNKAAMTLYSSLGFQTSGRRKNYYKDGEDALIFEIAVPQ